MNQHGGYYGDLPLEDRSININPLGTPDELLDILEEELKNLSAYPTLDAREGREAMATMLHLEKDNILLGNGAISLLYLYARTTKWKRVLLVDPSFNEYHRAFSLAGSEVHRLILQRPFLPSREEILNQARKKKVDLVVLCNPCNPTGVFMEKEELLLLYEELSLEKIQLFLDESFLDFTGKESLRPSPGLFQLRSLTKYYALPGLRLGYCIADAITIQAMLKNMEPWSVNHLAEQAVLHLSELSSYEEESLELIRMEREKILMALDELGLWHSKSCTNFVLIYVEMQDFFDRMVKKGFYLRRCGDFAGLSNNYFRFAIGLPEKNDALIQALKEVLCFT